MNRPIRLIIADDHELYRDGFKLLLKNQNDLELIDEAEDGKQLLDVVDKHQPDIVITDIKMPVIDGIEACKIIKDKYPWIGIIALSMFNDDHLIVDMLEAGAKGYLTKNTNKYELLQAAKSIFQGGTYYCSDTSKKLTGLLFKSKYDPYKEKEVILTSREKEIIILICKEFCNKEIASALGLKVRTIESYRDKIQEKIGSKNMIGIAIYALKTNLYKLEEA
ncbi:MAG TPA: response regulator transcription factor [Segetibacter sp.]|jgi:DNA-binding NarL/FixJ family response regulator